MGLCKQTVVVAGNDAIVRHAWESESGPGDGRWNVSKIGVLQVWQKQPTGWRAKLLRSSGHFQPKACRFR